MLTMKWFNQGTYWYTSTLPMQGTLPTPAMARFRWYRCEGGKSGSAQVSGYLHGYRGRAKPHPCTHLELNGSVQLLSPRSEGFEQHYPTWWPNDTLQSFGYYPEPRLTYYQGSKEPTSWINDCLIAEGEIIEYTVPEIYTGGYCYKSFHVKYEYQPGRITRDKPYRVQEVSCRQMYEYDRYSSDGETFIKHITYDKSWNSTVYWYWHEANTLEFSMASRSIAYSEQHCDWLCDKLFLLSPVPEGDCVVDAVKDLKSLDINTITAVQGLVNCWKDIKELIASAHGHVSMRWLNSLYLQMLYGFSNTVRDARDISCAFADWAKTAMSEKRHQVTHASKGTTYSPHDARACFDFSAGYEVTTLTLDVDTLDDGIAQAARSLMDLDVFPELGNIWDVVPFSFVVDWFIPFGDLWDAIDANTYRSTLRVWACCISYNYIFDGVSLYDWINLPRGIPYEGAVELELYQRTITHEIPFPSLQLHVPGKFTQWLPAGALLYQMLGNRR